MKVVAAVGVIACVIAMRPGVAHASCGGSSVELAPAAGAELPPHPTIYVFVPPYHDGGVFSSPDAALEVELVARSDSALVHAVTVLADSGEVTIRYTQPDEPPARALVATYRIGAPLPHHDAVIIDVHHDASAWMCSYTNLIVLETAGNATAYRFDWRDHSPPTIIPGPSPALGHASCDAYNAYVDELREFDLVALFADGSELALGRAKLLLDHYRVRLPAELAPAADISPHVVGIKYPSPSRQPPLRRWLLLGGSLACLIGLLGVSRLVPGT